MEKINRKYKLAPGEIIPLNMDFMFTTIFNKEENIDILENFISCYLEIPLNKVKGNLKLIKRKLDINNKNESSNEVDLIFTYEDKTINIELSNERKSTGIIERNIVYASKIHSKQLRYGEKNYNKIHETIQINLNNFRCNKDDIKEVYYLRNEKGNVLSKKLRIDMVDIVKGSEICYPNSNNKLSRWCKVFISKNDNELKTLLGDDLMEKESSNKLVEEINTLSSDDEYVELYTKLSRKEMEYNTYIYEAKEEGYNSGFQLGHQSGLEEGRKVGIEQGIEQEKNYIAKSMLKENIDVNTISRCTGLTIDEINNMK